MKYCRVCLKTDSLEILTTEYREILFQITTVYIDESENEFICPECLKRLLYSYDFRLEAIKADLWFREQAEITKDCVKEETEITESHFVGEISTTRKKRRRKALKNVKKRRKKYICDKCESQFNHKIEIFRHMRECHIIKEYICPEKDCGKVFTLQRIYNKHLSSHNPGPQWSQWICEYCAKIFGSKYKLTLHSRIHTNIRPYKCDKCPASFKQPTDLNTHLKSLHSNERPFTCVDCGLSFKIPNSLRSHRKRKHNQERMLECNECHKKVMCSAELKDHVAIYHRGERNHVCKFCTKTYTKAYHLRRHMSDNHKELYMKLIESGELRTVNRSSKLMMANNVEIVPTPQQVPITLTINC